MGKKKKKPRKSRDKKSSKQLISSGLRDIFVGTLLILIDKFIDFLIDLII